MIHIVINSLGKGGAERSIINLAEGLLAQGRDFRILCLFSIDEYELDDALKGKVVRLQAAGMAQAVQRLLKRIRLDRPDVIFSLMPQANIAAVLVGLVAQVPVVTSERTTPVLHYKQRWRLTLALLPHLFSRASLFISEYALREGLPAGWISRRIRSRAIVLHNPVAAPGAQEAAETRARRVERLSAFVENAPDSKLKLLIATRLVPGKGVGDFLRAASSLLANRRVQLLIAGDGPERPALTVLTERLGLNENVAFCGFLATMGGAYNEADVVVLTSENEGFGRVGFEAYLAGCLVAGTTKNSFVAELIPDAAAWVIAEDLGNLEVMLGALAKSPIPADGSDIANLGRALDLETHTRQFLRLIDGVRINA